MKKEYLELELDVIFLDGFDVITASKDSDVVDDPNKPGDEWW